MSYGDPKWQEWVLNEEQSLPLLEHAYKVGINTWDTVRFCSSEEIDILFKLCSPHVPDEELR